MPGIPRTSKPAPPSSTGASSVTASLTPESIYLQVERIIESWTFRSAASQRDFLRYAVTETLQGRGHLLKEYSIGIAVFHKKESFDPRLDSIVRTEARKLRARLARYYDQEGKSDSIRIAIPVGKYAPVLSSISALTLPAIPWRQQPAMRQAAVSLFSAATGHGPGLRIAVLPFMNRGPAKKDEFFSDGLTDELTHAFSRIPDLEIVARTSAFQFKGQLLDIREVGRRLNVHAVVEGGVRRSGNRLRILVQLDDATTGATVWSESYDRKLKDLFAVQSEISNMITAELGSRFCGGRDLIPAKVDSCDPSALSPEVYQEYLRGQQFWNLHTIEGFESAIGCFQHAISKEIRYARAYASLAYCYVMLPVLKADLPSNFIPKVRMAATKALRLDSSVGEAHIALALPHIQDCNWAAAGDEFRRGLALCPSDVIGHAWYGTYLLSIGRGEEALREHHKVLDLDPASASAAFCLGQTLYCLRRSDEAIERFRRALAIDPSFPRAHALLGLACLRKGSYARGIAELESAQELTPGPGRVKADLAYAHAVARNRDRALETLNGFLGQFKPDSFSGSHDR